MLSGEPFVAVTRGGLIESLHSVAACAVDADGDVLLALGTIDELVYLRSAAKPFIAAAAVRDGVAERFGFDDRELAVMAASHGGEPFHIAAVRSILGKIGATVDDLQCGAHPPSYAPAAAALARTGEVPTALHNNCSGKHAGILALSRLLDASFDGYLNAGHPAQQRILAFCERLTDDRFDADRLGVDGCGVPVYATTLRKAAYSFARFAGASVLEGADAAALLLIRTAMIREPNYVAGTGRFDTDLGVAAKGRLVAKAGAEAVHATAILDRGAGLVMKVVDGAQRAVAPAALSLLRQLGALDDEAMETLAAHARVLVSNVAGRQVGVVAALDALAIGARD